MTLVSDCIESRKFINPERKEATVDTCWYVYLCIPQFLTDKGGLYTYMYQRGISVARFFRMGNARA